MEIHSRRRRGNVKYLKEVGHASKASDGVEKVEHVDGRTVQLLKDQSLQILKTQIHRVGYLLEALLRECPAYGNGIVPRHMSTVYGV